MTTSALLPVIGFIGATVFLFYRAVYRQERKAGRSHDASLIDSTVFSVFLLGSVVLNYAAVVAHYA